MTAKTPPNAGLLLIISGPSGAGKTTIARAVQQRLDTLFSVSMTTRPKTAKDREGIDYHFVDCDRFHAARDRGELLEWAEVYEGLFYGTPREPVEAAIAAGKVIILEIDVEGAIQVRRSMPDAFGIFILPPSEDALLQRLRDRRREDEAAIQRRFAKAKHEIDLARRSGAYDVFVINDDLEHAIDQTVRQIEAERSRRRPNSE